MKKDIINDLTDSELKFGKEDFIMPSDITNDEKDRILNKTFTKVSVAKKSKIKPLIIKITAVAAAVAIIITAGILGYGYFGKNTVQVATTSVKTQTVPQTTEKEILFTPEWQKTGGFGGAGYGSFNSTAGKYVVEDFSVSDSFKLPYSGKVNVYKRNDNKTSKEDTAKIEKAFLSFYDSDGIKDNESEQFKTKDGSKISIYSEYNKTASLYFSSSQKYGENFREKYKTYSLTALKKDGEVLAKKVADNLSKATGINYIFADAIKADDYEFWYPTSDEESYLSNMSVYKFRFKTEQSGRKLNATDSETAPIIYISDTENIKTLAEGETQYLEITVGPDMTVWRVDDNIIKSDFALNETRNMFTLDQIKEYKLFSNDSTTYFSDTKNDKVIFDSMDGFYYNFMDAAMSVEDDNTVAAYALLSFHLQSKPSKTYQSGVYIDAVREGVSTYDSLYNDIYENQPADDGDNDDEKVIPAYEVTKQSFSEDFGFKSYDHDTDSIIYPNAPYIYTVKNNPNAEKNRTIIEKLFGNNFEYESEDNGCTSINNENASFRYSKLTGLSEYMYTKSDAEAKEYLKEYKGKTMDVVAMRNTANNVAKEFSQVCGTLKFVENSQTLYNFYIGEKEYSSAAYVFEYKNSYSEYSLDSGIAKVNADFATWVNYPCEIGTFYVFVLPDNTVSNVINGTTQGIEKTREAVINKDELLSLTSEKENDSAEFVSVTFSCFWADVYSNEVNVYADLYYNLKSDDKKGTETSDNKLGNHWIEVSLE